MSNLLEAMAGVLITLSLVFAYLCVIELIDPVEVDELDD